MSDAPFSHPVLLPPEPRTIRWRGGSLVAGPRALVVGIVNVTPDSFQPVGRRPDPAAAVEHALALVAEGADVIDVGGESTRPGAEEVPAAEEIARVVPVIRALAGRIPVPLSVDTTKAEVARAAFAAGACWLNDVSAMSRDEEIPGVVAGAGAAVVLMHSRGTPRDMQGRTEYRDVVAEVAEHLAARRDAALAAGIPRESILLDPGIGFAKSAQGSVELLAGIPALAALGHPVYVGASRKSFLGHRFGIPPEERLAGSLGAVAAAVAGGAHLVRVHDVKETRRLVDVISAVAVASRARGMGQ
ncbi:dihydropteroate synthase [Myxococcota bacterium]|nr:dihydropteroate synthase [Myxococcota bacterium]